MGFKKIIPSSEYYLLNDVSADESLIPHPEDPVRDISKNYWKNSETGDPIKNIVPSDSEENKIYLNEENTYYTNLNIKSAEYVKIFDYKKIRVYSYSMVRSIEKITLMIARL